MIATPIESSHEVLVAHVWVATLDREIDRGIAESFTHEEIARASRLRCEEDRAAFFARRAFVRLTIASHLECAPTSISVAHAATGQPFLLRDGQPLPIGFSMS